MVLDIEFSYLWDKNYAWRIKYADRNIFKKDFKDYDLQVYVTDYTFLSDNILSLGLKSEDKINVCNEYEKSLIEYKVKSINKKYKSNKIERCKHGETYWYINLKYDDNLFELRETKDDYIEWDNNRFKRGNYFKTKQEAQTKIDKLIKCFYED